MIAAADQAGVMCAVLHCMHWSPPLAAARDMLASGEAARSFRSRSPALQSTSSHRHPGAIGRVTSAVFSASFDGRLEEFNIHVSTAACSPRQPHNGAPSRASLARFSAAAPPCWTWGCTPSTQPSACSAARILYVFNRFLFPTEFLFLLLLICKRPYVPEPLTLDSPPRHRWNCFGLLAPTAKRRCCCA